MEGKSHSESWSFIKSFFLSALLKNWIVWGVAQYVNMSYVPIKVNSKVKNIMVFWNSNVCKKINILSYKIMS